ncbi:hypothetical protein A3J17_03165 [Candidatus Curtissbacteria bacterium RIFCSPLOWO2_02_FULL_40_11]|uniref:SCP domain-containing protein n=2 Tax=Candidatus Curtissiibacteriota TaxID=1752717 RepID=A0A1F5GB65_9BACT|nr:MAG: hypothetical protein A2775_01380 [Candidatus Curtissbacteria bacterium RIFCSPHIGHO2_01_FULL_39_57]OGD89067.1 MAG: hypothetical protein A3D04_00865 [Candidatus Curtissbacteria bacterium RIFCSPHIGHO2_02_FULL_40_16b]OGD99973.1 MAG: hypothetical protein A3J17_03165 [Candidatus Curtissbacteria bacterium RIFCSPLOWO2_02_FULL_40_11]OGE13716.1 MAG: hypothetical protein A3G14_03635 [Candidatus Curtissbacteria bacterium RIFCSPLOWO2_12_FULL_38_9]
MNSERQKSPVAPFLERRITRRRLLSGAGTLGSGLLIACAVGTSRNNLESAVELPQSQSTPTPEPIKVSGSEGEKRAIIELTEIEYDLFEGLNNIRAAHGLYQLSIDRILVNIARERSNDMAVNDYFAHTSPDGVTAFELMNLASYPYGWAGEILARNDYPQDSTIPIAIRDWMASPDHRDVILGSHYLRIGVGWAKSDGMNFYSAVFTGPA